MKDTWVPRGYRPSLDATVTLLKEMADQLITDDPKELRAEVGRLRRRARRCRRGDGDRRGTRPCPPHAQRAA